MTTVSEITSVVNLDSGYACRQSVPVTPIDAFLLRVEEVLRRGTFKSEREWCRAAGVSPSYIAAVRNRGASGGTGEVSDLKREQVVRLAKAAGLDPTFLLGEEISTMTPPTRVSPSSGLDDAVRAFDWPGDLSAAQASEVLSRARDEAADNPELPTKFWIARLGKIAADVRDGVTAKSRVRRSTAGSK